MSAAATAAAPAEAAPSKGGKKKLIIIIVAALLVLAIGGGAAFFLLKKKHAEGEEEDGGDGHAPAAAQSKSKAKAKDDGHGEAPAQIKRDPKHPPAFVPLDPFTVNLADKESERYAQIAVTLELSDPKTADELKTYMPAIRNNILLVLSSKTAAQLLSREGKEKLARSIQIAAVKPLGFIIDEEDEDEDPEAESDAPKKKKKKKKAPVPAYLLPIVAVHFSNFIVQ